MKEIHGVLRRMKHSRMWEQWTRESQAEVPAKKELRTGKQGVRLGAMGSALIYGQGQPRDLGTARHQHGTSGPYASLGPVILHFCKYSKCPPFSRLFPCCSLCQESFIAQPASIPENPRPHPSRQTQTPPPLRQFSQTD